VATNAALDELRRRKRRPVPGLPSFDGSGVPSAPPGGMPAAGVVPPVEGLVADRVDVDAAVSRLPEEFRAAVVLRDLCDLEYAEIADILGVPPGTVRSRIARGRGLLADLLGNRTPAPDRPSTRP
jgi:RNA polymerase sigma-70 factor (ECF subfamily)